MCRFQLVLCILWVESEKGIIIFIYCHTLASQTLFGEICVLANLPRMKG